jgi:hypothetical protein
MFETIKPIRKPFLPLNLQLFAEPSDPNPGQNPSPTPDPNDPNKGKMFTQAELDAAIQSRLSRAEKAAQKALAKELGFDSVEALQAALKKPDGGYKGKEGDDKKTEPVDIEKLLDERLKEREKEQNEKTFKRLLTAEVKVLANELGFADWEDALKLADLSKCKENDKGEIEGVKEALEDLAKKKPHLLKQKLGGGKFGADVRNSPDEKKKTNERLIELAKNRGVVTKPENDPWARK